MGSLDGIGAIGQTGILAFLGAFMVVGLILLVILIITLVFMWKVFEKAGQPGWAALVPFYNFYILTQIVGRPWWFVLLVFCGVLVGIFFGNVIQSLSSLVSFAALMILWIDTARSFGKDIGIGILTGLLPPVGLGILAFGDAKYKGADPLEIGDWAKG